MFFSFFKGRKKQVFGDLNIIVNYSTSFNYDMTLTLKELKLTKEITTPNPESKMGTCRFTQIPAGTYTAILSGFMGDPNYCGKNYGHYQNTYGKFQNIFTVNVKPFQRNYHTIDLKWEFIEVTIEVMYQSKLVNGAEVMVKKVNPNFQVTRDDKGTQYSMEKGKYNIVVQYKNVFYADVFEVNQGNTHFIVDLDNKRILSQSELVNIERESLEEDFTKLMEKTSDTLLEEESTKVVEENDLLLEAKIPEFTLEDEEPLSKKKENPTEIKVDVEKEDSKTILDFSGTADLEPIAADIAEKVSSKGEDTDLIFKDLNVTSFNLDD